MNTRFTQMGITTRRCDTNCSIEEIYFSVLVENNANGAINLQQLRNNMYYHSSHGSCHFVRKPKSASKIRLVRWPALFETRASRLPILHATLRKPIAIGSQAAGRLHTPQDGLRLVGQAGPGLRPNLFLLVWGDTYVIEKKQRPCFTATVVNFT